MPASGKAGPWGRDRRESETRDSPAGQAQAPCVWLADEAGSPEVKGGRILV